MVQEQTWLKAISGRMDLSQWLRIIDVLCKISRNAPSSGAAIGVQSDLELEPALSEFQLLASSLAAAVNEVVIRKVCFNIRKAVS